MKKNIFLSEKKNNLLILWEVSLIGQITRSAWSKLNDKRTEQQMNKTTNKLKNELRKRKKRKKKENQWIYSLQFILKHMLNWIVLIKRVKPPQSESGLAWWAPFSFISQISPTANFTFPPWSRSPFWSPLLHLFDLIFLLKLFPPSIEPCTTEGTEMSFFVLARTLFLCPPRGLPI